MIDIFYVEKLKTLYILKLHLTSNFSLRTPLKIKREHLFISDMKHGNNRIMNICSNT